MTSRLESAAATRRALLRAARELLKEGGPQNVTLREVGARADVSRGAAYRHFADKESLLAAVGAESWDRIADALAQLGPAPDGQGAALLRSAVYALVAVAFEEPEVYRMMFIAPTADPEPSIQAAGRAQIEFLRIVGSVFGDGDAHLFGALLLATANGMASMAASSHLAQMWETTPDDVVTALVGMIADRGSS